MAGAAAAAAAAAAAGSHSLAVPVHAREVAARTHVEHRRKPTARRRRELLELVFWFVVGGLGGLAVLAAVRMAESALR